MSSLNITSSQISSPRIFDHTLRLKRDSRYSEGDDFLGQDVAKQIGDRLSFVKRKFPSAAILGHTNQLVEEIEKQGHGEASLQTGFLDENLPFKWKSLNLLLSHLNLQWINDLPGYLWQIRHLLKPDGLFIGSLLGGQTLDELRQSLMAAEIELYGGVSPRVIPLVDLYSASQLLTRAGFGLPVADRVVFKVTYPSLFDLIKDLRAMNLTNVMFERNKSWVNHKFFQYADKIYQERFGDSQGRRVATFEVIFITGWAPHESQQKALKPGSAQATLTQVL